MESEYRLHEFFCGIVTGEGQAGSKIVVSLRVLVLNDKDYDSGC